MLDKKSLNSLKVYKCRILLKLEHYESRAIRKKTIEKILHREFDIMLRKDAIERIGGQNDSKS